MKKDTEKYKGQIVYFSHGGGPLPILNDESHMKMVEFMKELPNKLKKPEAIVVVSAHWEENKVTIQSGKKPEILYDYYGFPPEAYKIEYPALGKPELAKKISDLFTRGGIENVLDDKRPYDHGSYIPLMMMYPEADIPVIQISLNHNLDSETHIKMGKALRPLLGENILFIGSGFSFHNMRQFKFQVSPNNIEDKLNDSFQESLIDICCMESDKDKSIESLIAWEELDGARYCHPREEHLLPLMVCLGLSTKRARKVFDDYIIGKRAVAFLWK